MVTCCRDGYARVWDVATGMPVSERLRHDTEVIYARFDDTGTHVLAASAEGMIKKWPLPSVTNRDIAWLPDLAELVARRSLDDRWKSISLDLGPVESAREWQRLRDWSKAHESAPALLKAYLEQ